MANLKYEANYQDGKRKTTVVLSMLSYKEGDLHVVYSPSLDMFGYGNTELEARRSFDCALEEFIRYTYNKRTIEQELKRLGWNVSKFKTRRPVIQAPDWNVLLRDNEYLTDVVNNKPHHQISKEVQIPAFV